ncbi:MAG: YggS family pyridoxal phosphate-dependent enzyme [Candidatus Omnitrophica bacterium]|nr:YggS family pyridoxal phosphate-dependent enzyme [Candidatus Omnitrophota bacterium]
MIKDNVLKILGELPEGVLLEAAAKARTAEEILEAVDAGVSIIGENYIQEAEKVFREAGSRAKWHFIGHLQKNKVKKAIKIFDMIETIDSAELAEAVSVASAKENKVMSVLIEVNSGREERKSGVFPEDAEKLVKELSELDNIKVEGLMTMGPLSGNPEEARPYFKETKKIFDMIGKIGLPGAEMKYLSMGMSNSYKIAIEEGANIVRIGTAIFGNRP